MVHRSSEGYLILRFTDGAVKRYGYNDPAFWEKDGQRGGQSMQTLKELIEKLPPELQEEVRDFVEFLLERRARRPKRKPKFDWAGALRDLRDRYSSVELQHKIAEWRIGER